jgi:hypothetical protein
MSDTNSNADVKTGGDEIPMTFPQRVSLCRVSTFQKQSRDFMCHASDVVDSMLNVDDNNIPAVTCELH